MNYKKLQIVTFLSILVLMFFLVLVLFKPFLNILAMGVILAILFWPLYQRLLNKFKSPTFAALLCVIITVLIFLIPLWLFGQLLFNQIVNTYQDYRSGGLVFDQGVLVHRLPLQIQGAITNLTQDINGFIGRLANNAFQTITSLLSNLAGFIVSIFLTFFALFYLFRDGEHIKRVFMDISPLAEKQENLLFKKIAVSVSGVVKGSFLIALIQGSVATIGFIIFGVPQPLLWGIFTVISALVPTIGTSLALIPAVVYLALTGQVGAAVGLAIWGILAVGLIDNIVGPKLIGSRTQLHPLLVLFSIIGGVQLFGFLGFLIGPIVMAIFVALVDMYRTDFKSYLEK